MSYNKDARVRFVRAMGEIVRSSNNEDFIESWLLCGVADGDYEMDDDYIDSMYCDDETLQSLGDLFLRILNRIYKSGDGLYINGIVSDGLYKE